MVSDPVALPVPAGSQSIHVTAINDADEFGFFEITGRSIAVKHILNRHGARLAIESKLGQGSRFTVFLPLIPER
jgi:hypothetical protein